MSGAAPGSRLASFTGVGGVKVRVIQQPPADRQVGDDADAQGNQLIGRADAGAQQDGWAAVAAG